MNLLLGIGFLLGFGYGVCALIVWLSWCVVDGLDWMVEAVRRRRAVVRYDPRLWESSSSSS